MSEPEAPSEFEEQYDAETRDHERKVIESAVLSHTIRHLEPSQPVWVAPDAPVIEAVRAMVEGRTGSVLVGDSENLLGIFTERDVMKRVVHEGRDPRRTPIREVMTPDPDCLTADHRVGYTLKKMVLRKYRHIPVVDKDGRAVGVVSSRSIAKFIVSLFPEATLNLPPGDQLKNPHMLDGG